MPAVSEPARGHDAGGARLALPVRFRPFGVRVAAVLFGLVLVLVLTAVWVALPDNVQYAFSFGQWFTVTGLMLSAFVVGHALGRCRVDADESGVTVVNGYRTHRFAWGQLVAVTLRPGNPWAVLDLNDGTTRAAMGIQGSDGERARRQVRQLRALIEAHAASEPQA